MFVPSRKSSPGQAQDGQEGGDLGLGQIASIFSPEGVIMLTVAVLLDLVGIFLLMLGLDDFGLMDLLGLGFFGFWMLIRGSSVKTTKGASQKIAQVTNWVKRLRYLRPLLFFLEFIPFVGAGPWWTLIVYSELKST